MINALPNDFLNSHFNMLKHQASFSYTTRCT